MRIEEWIALLPTGDGEEKEKEKKAVPLGVDSVGNIVYARREEGLFFSRHTCVTGNGKSNFLRRLLLSLAHIYPKEKICFLVLSPYAEYGELLRMRSMSLTLPYIRTKEDLSPVVDTLKELLRQRDSGKGYPRLAVVMDGVEELEGCNRNGDLEEQRALIDLLARREDVDVFTGVDLTKSIFSGYPGAFVGVGNCLVATRELGKADVTYAQGDASLTLPLPVSYPSSPSITETVVYLNSLSKKENGAGE